MRLLLFSDIRIYTEGIITLLSEQDNMQLVASENRLEDVIKQVEDKHPQIILLDMTMHGSTAFAKRLVKLFPQVKIVALAAQEYEPYVVECAKIGIAGFIARNASTDDFISAICSTHNGVFCCPANIASLLLNNFHQFIREDSKKYYLPSNDHLQVPALDLTRRETQILELMSDGMSNKEISAFLVIELSTVKNHVHNILVKLGARNRVQAVNMLKHNSYTDDARTITHETPHDLYN